LTPYDNAEAFNKIFEYFHSRQRYAVVEKGKPALVKELYIIPVEVGANLPEHIEMLEHCTIKKPVEERLLLASLTMARSPDKSPPVVPDLPTAQLNQAGQNGSLPQHIRQSISGPAGSPITSQTPFSPSHNVPPASPYGATAAASPAGYAAPSGVPSANFGAHHPFPPNPYGAQVQPNPLYAPPQQQQTGPAPNPRIAEILGDLQYTQSARQILQASPHLSDQQLQGLRNVLAENPESRENLAVLTAILQG
jgi:hypothetical protein